VRCLRSRRGRRCICIRAGLVEGQLRVCDALSFFGKDAIYFFVGIELRAHILEGVLRFIPGRFLVVVQVVELLVDLVRGLFVYPGLFFAICIAICCWICWPTEGSFRVPAGNSIGVWSSSSPGFLRAWCPARPVSVSFFVISTSGLRIWICCDGKRLSGEPLSSKSAGFARCVLA